MKQPGIFLLVSVLLVIAGISHCCSQDHPAVPITNDRDKILLTVRVGNYLIPGILLDTGFDFDGIILYNPAYRDSLDLSGAIRVSLGGAGDESAQEALMLDSGCFYLGDRKFTGQRIIVLLSDIYKGFPSNGIIGYSLFGKYVVEIDTDRGVLVLHDTATFRAGPEFTRIPLYFKGNRMIPWMDVSVVTREEEPVRISAYIDYADRDPVVLLERPVMKFTLPEASGKKLLGTGLSGDVYGSRGKIAKLMIGPYQLNDVKVAIAPAQQRSKQQDADAVIGSGALNRFTLIFDYRNSCLYLRPNNSFNKPFSD